MLIKLLFQLRYRKTALPTTMSEGLFFVNPMLLMKGCILCVFNYKLCKYRKVVGYYAVG